MRDFTRRKIYTIVIDHIHKKQVIKCPLQDRLEVSSKCIKYIE